MNLLAHFSSWTYAAKNLPVTFGWATRGSIFVTATMENPVTRTSPSLTLRILKPTMLSNEFDSQSDGLTARTG